MTDDVRWILRDIPKRLTRIEEELGDMRRQFDERLLPDHFQRKSDLCLRSRPEREGPTIPELKTATVPDWSGTEIVSQKRGFAYGLPVHEQTGAGKVLRNCSDMLPDSIPAKTER